MSRRAAVILAAGQGTRMKSPLPKVLHAVGGRTMLDRAIDAAEALGCEKIVVVVGAHSPEVGAAARSAAGGGAPRRCRTRRSAPATPCWRRAGPWRASRARSW